jgi:hypothetical protein
MSHVFSLHDASKFSISVLRNIMINLLRLVFIGFIAAVVGCGDSTPVANPKTNTPGAAKPDGISAKPEGKEKAPVKPSVKDSDN